MHLMGKTELGICEPGVGWGGVESRVGWDGVGWNGMGLEGGLPRLGQLVHPQAGGTVPSADFECGREVNSFKLSSRHIYFFMLCCAVCLLYQ